MEDHTSASPEEDTRRKAIYEKRVANCAKARARKAELRRIKAEAYVTQQEIAEKAAQRMAEVDYLLANEEGSTSYEEEGEEDDEEDEYETAPSFWSFSRVITLVLAVGVVFTPAFLFTTTQTAPMNNDQGGVPQIVRG